MVDRFVTRIVAIGVLGIAGLSLGCGESPSSPTAVPAVPAPPAAAAVMAVTSVTPSSGPTIGGDYISINGDRFESGMAVALDGIAARVTSVTSRSIVALTPPHRLGTVDLLVMTLDGQSVTVKAAYAYASFTVAAASGVVTAGGELMVTFEAPSGRGCPGGGDWIAIYRVGAPDETGASNGHSDLWYEHLCGSTSGIFTLRAPSEPGTYEFRYMVGGTSVARSNPVTVQAP